MIRAELMNAFQIFASNQKEILTEISTIYKTFQEMKLKEYGLTWGYCTGSKTDHIYDVMELDYDSKFIYINRTRGCAFVFPIRWLNGSNWIKEAKEGIAIEKNEIIMRKLSD